MPHCSSCGNEVNNEDKFCSSCGAKLWEESQPETTPSRSAKPPKNTSGQGKLAVIPEEIKGWNWGAFLLSFIWSIHHNVWIGLLSLIPYAGIIMLIILGVKGNEWAWQNSRWDSIEHFKKSQKQWSNWGWGVLVIGLLIWFIIAVNT